MLLSYVQHRSIKRRLRASLAGMLAFAAMMVLLPLSPTNAAIPASERAFLQSLFVNTHGDAWVDKTNWNGAAGTECTWARITCNADESHVIEIVLNNNNLVGTLPTTINQMSALRRFVVALNHLEGPIPSFNTLTELQVFNASFNTLNGPIPPLAGLTALREFEAAVNQLSGSIPSFNELTTLEFFNVGKNRLTGSIPAFSGLSSLRSFIVADNQLTGSIPSLSGLTALQFFVVGNNQLTGAIPAVPSPSALTANISQVCPNQLTVSPDADWDAATPGATWDVGCIAARQQQFLAFGAAPTLTVGGTGVVTATATPPPGSTAPVNYSSLTPIVCSVNPLNGAVSVSAQAFAGDVCSITADIAGDTVFNSATQVQQSTSIEAAAIAVAVTVPTLGQWALIMLAIVLGIMAAITLGASALAAQRARRSNDTVW
jgi:hypothetical protein